VEEKVKIGQHIICWQSSCVINEQGTHRLEPLPMAFLKFLSEHQGQVVSREQLLQAVWHNRQVSDDAIRRVVRMLRTALGDDAKSPKYIKTLPLQGYMLLPQVTDIVGQDDISQPTELKTAGLMKYKSAILILTGSLLFVAVIVILFKSLLPFIIEPPSVKPNIERLTHLAGAEAKGNFCPAINTVLFVHRSDSDAPLALYSKNLTTTTVKRLSFNEDNIYFAKFSPDCKQVAYTVQQEQGRANYLANYTEQGLTDVIPLMNENEYNSQDNTRLLSWSADGLSLYFSTRRTTVSDKNNSVTSMDINNSAVITQYFPEENTWQQVTFSLVEGVGDYVAQESIDGRYLSVLRNTVGRRVTLLILDLEKKSIAVERHLPFYPRNIVWFNDDTQRLALSSGRGDFYYYNMLTNILKEQKGSNITLTEVYYHCGEKCFFMRSHDLNYYDIKEIPNPFTPAISIAGIHLESEGADFNPVYDSMGKTIYYTNKQEDEIKLLRRSSSGVEEILFRYDPKKSIHHLSIGPNEKYATGKHESRIFILDLETKAIRFITAQQEQAFFPLFSQDGKAVYFSRLEQDKVVLQKYDLALKQVSAFEEGFYARFENKASEVYLLNSEYELYKQLSDGRREFIVQLGGNPNYSWQVFDNFVYFTKSKGGDVIIHRFNMDTGEKQQKVLFKNSHSFHFRLHPSGDKMLIVEYLLANSEMIKIIWE
jgi:transcriptional activator of cad operon